MSSSEHGLAMAAAGRVLDTGDRAPEVSGAGPRSGALESSRSTAETPPASTSAQLIALFLRELAGFFYSPMSYLAWTVFLVASGYLFVTSLRDGGAASLSGTFLRMTTLLLFVTPLLTMRLVAEELRLGTLEVLMTDPVSEVVIILSKYAAALVFLVCVIAPTVAYPFALAQLGQPDPGPVLAGYVGLFLLGSLFCAIGLCASAVTSNQIAAAALAFTVLLLFWALGRAADGMAPGSLREALAYLSAFARYTAFRRGVVDTRSVIYCASLAAFFLFVASTALGLRRLR